MKKESAAEKELRENPVNQFKCDTCKELDSMNFREFKQHLKTEHGVSEENMKGTKSMTMHIDGDFWYSYDYKWTLENGLVFFQHIEQVRDKDDMMRY